MTAVAELTLTQDQQSALDAFFKFLSDPLETVFVLSGYSGCGKSTLVHNLLDRLPDYQKTLQLISPDFPVWDMALTATTNKAAENLALITGHEVKTIHSYLGLRVSTNFKTGETELATSRSTVKKSRVILFIDEASYIDSALLKLIFEWTENCKIVFIGDPAQLTPVKATGTPVFDAGFNGAALKQVVRQAAGNPIVDLSTKFRNTVETGEFFSFKPDGNAVVYLDRDAFNAAVLKEFTRPDWRYRDSKILGWTNKLVIAYNAFVREHAKGDPQLQAGDYAIVNSFCQVGKQTLKTDQLVQISSISEDTECHGVQGRWFTCDGRIEAFMPNSLEAKNGRLKTARANDEYPVMQDIEQSWIDLRAAFAQTINKAQGSTYDEVYIDLDDVRRCNSGDQIARMLYVGVSRARNRVYLTGDLA